MNIKKSWIVLFPIIAVLSLFIGGCVSKNAEYAPVEPLVIEQRNEIETETPAALPEKTDIIEYAEETPPQNTQEPRIDTNAISLKDEKLYVYFFDVGQADCALVKTGEHAMLIDAGDIGQDSLVLDYLAALDVHELDFLVATHPHADHIGSMPAVIRAMDNIEELLMPDAIHTTATFENLLDAIERKDISVTIPQSGEKFTMGNAAIQILAPNSENYENLNNYSIVLRIEYGQNAFLFTGDAEDVSEYEQLSNNFDLKADVLKVSHHGSETSTTPKYLETVSPKYAVISCGKDNSYGHPSNDVIARLAESAATVFRTDLNGTISFVSDGESISVNTEREAISDAIVSDSPTDAAPIVPDTAENPVESTAVSYIGNKNSKIFHLPSCGTLPAEKNRIYFSARENALNSGMRPCKNCNP